LRAVRGTPYRLNYRVIFIVHTQITNVAPGRKIQDGGPRAKTNDSRTYSVEPLGLEDVSIDTVELPPASRAPPVDTPCNMKRACDMQLM
jgi:hypothetical protein